MQTSDLINEFSPVLELINGCGLIESCQDNNILIAHNLFKESLILEQGSIYITNIDSPIVETDEIYGSINFITHGEEQFFHKELAVDCGFYLIEKIDSSSNYRIYFFTSNYYLIYERIINNVELVKDLFANFKEINSHVLNEFSRLRKDFAIQKDNYFKVPNSFKHSSNKDKLLDILKMMGVLKKDAKVTNEEWGLIDAYNYGKLYNIDMSHIFNLSKSEMEAKFNTIKNKLLK